MANVGGEIILARAKSDVRQKLSGGQAPPMANIRAKYFSPVCMDGACAAVCPIGPCLLIGALDTLRPFT